MRKNKFIQCQKNIVQRENLCIESFLRAKPPCKELRREHTGTKEHTFLTCNKMFLQKPYLTTHMKTHTGTKEHICLTCNKMFVRKSNLTRHEKIHNGVKDFVCGICNKAFVQKVQLIRHQKIHARNSCHELNCIEAKETDVK